jgi:hypothetical protein
MKKLEILFSCSSSFNFFFWSLLPSGAALALNKFKANTTMPSGKCWGSVALQRNDCAPRFSQAAKIPGMARCLDFQTISPSNFTNPIYAI